MDNLATEDLWNRRSIYGLVTNDTLPETSLTALYPPLFKDSKVLFGNVGCEPTYYPLVAVHPGILKCDNTILDSIWQSINENIINCSQFCDKHPWLNSCYEDGGNLELRSPFHYKTAASITRDFAQVTKLLKDTGFLPSSVVDRNVEGGCHITFNVPIYRDEKYRKNFANSLIGYLNTNPSIVWSLLAPEDNQSSRIAFKPIDYLSKGDFVTSRNNASLIELRFFMMPRTSEEFNFHIRVADAILKYVWNQMVSGKTFDVKNTRDSLRQYKIGKATKEVKQVLKNIGISFDEFCKFDKLQMLEERFQYPTKQYLV